MQTWGSHGDVRPFLALAEGLHAAGHDVTLVVTTIDTDAYARMASRPGLRIEAAGAALLGPAEAQGIMEAIYQVRDPMRQAATLMRLVFAPVEDDMFAAAQRLCAQSDLVIGHFIVHPLQVAAQHAGVPYASVFLAHGSLPSAHAHPLGTFGPTVNRALWWLTRRMLNGAFNHYPDRLRRQLGMPPVRDIIDDAWVSPRLTMVAVSPQICVRQPDWPASVHVCGFLDMPNVAVEGTLPPDLDAFLAAGEAPVYMTLGSWTPEQPAAQRATLALFTEAARLAGCRAIVQSPSWHDCGVVSDDRVLYVSAAPHHAIFPRCAAVVHHGGAGTTQAATLAGKPSVVIAHISEQEHWGSELRRLGIAGKVLRRRDVTAARLAARIGEVLRQPDMAARAAAIGAAMRQENGVQVAVGLIEREFGRDVQDPRVAADLPAAMKTGVSPRAGTDPKLSDGG
ncbi:glycosyltransferase [Massilia sp. YMA4]|uniref:glycosyltransferase n=1 Tax=Massilia sp. YMA4 TaxID=1593482 RepID=UPI001583D704|nr:glycosyltransferase [Massilia sp. YMA4]